MGHGQAERQGETGNLDRAGRFFKGLHIKSGQALLEVARVAVVSLEDFQSSAGHDLEQPDVNMKLALLCVGHWTYRDPFPTSCFQQSSDSEKTNKQKKKRDQGVTSGRAL